MLQFHFSIFQFSIFFLFCCLLYPQSGDCRPRDTTLYSVPACGLRIIDCVSNPPARYPPTTDHRPTDRTGRENERQPKKKKKLLLVNREAKESSIREQDFFTEKVSSLIRLFLFYTLYTPLAVLYSKQLETETHHSFSALDNQPLRLSLSLSHTLSLPHRNKDARGFSRHSLASPAPSALGTRFCPALVP